MFNLVDAVIIKSFSFGKPNILPIPYLFEYLGEYGSTPLWNIVMYWDVKSPNVCDKH